MATARNGKGTKEFDAYVRNLHRALWLTSVGAQLSSSDGPKIRGPLVHNPYSRTIADLNICHIRGESSET
ncbi:MAG: hypothetical protein ACKVP7_17800 [Hyphomicrobiaceae bacterium]